MEDARKILVVDDERMLHMMLKSVFASHGFEIISAFTGEEGLVLAKSERPELVILDVIMPGIKGREVCKRLKADLATRHIPVLFLTAKDSDDDVQAEREAGAVGHVTKPINSMSLLREVKKILQVN
jgi:DNA-binding response OmpR family regulator